MEKLAHRTYGAGSIAFIAIGALHTYVHLTELAGKNLQTRFDEVGIVRDVPAWDLFQGVSLLMGFLMITLGIANLAARHTAGRPPVGVALVNMAMLGSISIVGFLYLGPMQAYGGIVGVAMFGLPVIVAKRRAAATEATQAIAGRDPLNGLHSAALV